MDDKQLLLVKQSSIKKSKIIPLVPFRDLYIEKKSSDTRYFKNQVEIDRGPEWY